MCAHRKGGRMVQHRLNGLALMHAHREMELDLEKNIDLFANLHPKRMRMENILNEQFCTRQSRVFLE